MFWVTIEFFVGLGHQSPLLLVICIGPMYATISPYNNITCTIYYIYFFFIIATYRICIYDNTISKYKM